MKKKNLTRQIPVRRMTWQEIALPFVIGISLAVVYLLMTS
jgi:hypothetical protein